MICFRDREFCGSDCTNTGCDRIITDKVRSDALAWTRTFKPDAEGGLLAIADRSSRCPDYQPPKEAT